MQRDINDLVSAAIELRRALNRLRLRQDGKVLGVPEESAAKPGSSAGPDGSKALAAKPEAQP